MATQLLNSIDAAYPAMARLFAAYAEVQSFAFAGYNVSSGCDITPSGTAGRIQMAAGIPFFGSTERVCPAQSSIAASQISGLVDTALPRWATVEITTSATVVINLGTPFAKPVPNPCTPGNVPLAWLYIPANANNAVDADLSNPNGNAKIIDARAVMAVHPKRCIYRGPIAGVFTGVTNPLSQTSLITLGSLPQFPANSLVLGDIIEFHAAGYYLNNSANTTMQLNILVGGVIFCQYNISPALTASASYRSWVLYARSYFVTSGASAQPVTDAHLVITKAGSLNAMQQESSGSGANGDKADVFRPTGATVNTGNALDVDVKAIFGTSSAAGVVTLGSLIIEKIPV